MNQRGTLNSEMFRCWNPGNNNYKRKKWGKCERWNRRHFTLEKIGSSLTKFKNIGRGNFFRREMIILLISLFILGWQEGIQIGALICPLCCYVSTLVTGSCKCNGWEHRLWNQTVWVWISALLHRICVRMEWGIICKVFSIANGT